MNEKRPMYLNLLTMRFPITAIVSILHRISGVFVFLLIPLILWFFEQTLISQSAFVQMKTALTQPLLALLFWLLLASFFYHLVAGVRHLFMDVGIGETKTGGRVSSYLVFIVFIIGFALIGFWLW